MDKQEIFWAGKFGEQYTGRNQGDHIIASNKIFFSRTLGRCQEKIDSILELGANCGLNLLALQSMFPKATLKGVEINKIAYEELRKLPGVMSVQTSLYDLPVSETYDLVFTKGVLIHLNPDRLSEAYDKLFNLSNRYILIAEYYNPTPLEVPYRDQEGVLFKRDFAAEIIKKFPTLALLEYGFCYHADVECPQDDITWFLLEKWSRDA